MKSKTLEEAYSRLWQATENGTVSDEFFELREEARRFLAVASVNKLMQESGKLLLEVHQEWEEVGERLGVAGDELFEAYKMAKQKRQGEL